jgi:hypothetical protein
MVENVHATFRAFPIPFSLIKWKSRGAVAQLGERLVRNEEASGSIPLSSTNKLPENEQVKQ